MKLKLKTITAFTLSLLFTVSMSGIVIVNAQVVPVLELQLNKSSYNLNDKIFVSGQTNEVLTTGAAVSVIVIAPTGNIVTIDQINVNTNGYFNTEFVAGGPMWQNTGTYTVKVQYGSATKSVTFSFTATSSSATEKTGVLSISGHMVSYTITGGTVSNGFTDQDTNSIIVSINTSSDGELTITLPRELIDVNTQSGDLDNFIILIDGVEVAFAETVRSLSRTLTIPLEGGDEEVEMHLPSKIGQNMQQISEIAFYPQNQYCTVLSEIC